MPVTRAPPHRSPRAALPHEAYLGCIAAKGVPGQGWRTRACGIHRASCFHWHFVQPRLSPPFSYAPEPGETIDQGDLLAVRREPQRPAEPRLEADLLDHREWSVVAASRSVRKLDPADLMGDRSAGAGVQGRQ